MGLFTTAALGIGANLLSKKLTGKSLGQNVSGVLGLDKEAPQFNPDLSQLQGDIDKVREFRDRPITDVRQSAQIGIDRAGEDLNQALGSIQAGGMGRFRAMQDAIAESGGLDSGTTERLARTAQREGTLGQQRALSEFGDLRSDIRMGDLASQEAEKTQALFSMPQLSALPTQIQNQAAAANMRAKALTDANNAGAMGGLGSLAGGLIGYKLGGGPMGAIMGMGAGKGLFSMFSR